MKQFILVSASLFLLIGLFSCGQRDKSKVLGQYKYEESKTVLNETLKKKLGPWVAEGIDCYGIIILCDENGLPKKLKEIHAKVVSIQPDKIKMKALEDVIMSPVKGCSKIGIKKGETWDETDGDLFQNKEKAIQFIDTNYPDLRRK